MSTKSNDFRGRCESKDKVRKDGQPKHAGNFSYTTFHAQKLQSKDYLVRMIDDELIVGTHTPLMVVLPRPIVEAAMTDRFFGSYSQDGTQMVAGKEYEAHRRLTRVKHSIYIGDVRFILRMEIYTDGEVDFKFPEY